MGMLSFKKACRSCNRSNGLESSLGDFINNLDFYKKSTDFEISNLILKSLQTNGVSCEFCGDSNFDISNIKFDGYDIYNTERLKIRQNKKGSYVYIFNMTKRNNQAQTFIDDGDSFYNNFEDNKKFELKCKTEIQKHINSLPSSKLIHHPDGVLYICFTGTIENPKIEKFRYVGFSKNALINLTNNISRNPFD